ncbi:MAG: YbhB/YbcL family Raf kinase inhibitor-like protein [Actinomycetota bacterium]|nr:YbhB/YbcL family Raf kinase inhibitor-like protein [Actinomycetota bacterium]
MRRTASTAAVAFVLVLTGCKTKYEPYNGPNGAQPPPAAAQPSAASQASSASQPSSAQPSAPPPAPEPPRTPAPKHVPASIRLTSRSFANGGSIPSTFTCDGFDGSPDLAWSGVPAGTVELAVTMRDPKGRHGGFEHWALFGLKPSLTRLAANQVPPGAKQGMNDFHQTGYGGPCPGYTDATHHYVITLYAVNTQIPLTDDAPPGDVRDQVKGSTLAIGRLTGTYRRRSP